MSQPKKFSKEELQAAMEIVHREYFMHVLGLASHDPEPRELTYVKIPITTPEGGNYLVSILHIDGPKIDLVKLAEKAEALEKEQEIKNP